MDAVSRPMQPFGGHPPDPPPLPPAPPPSRPWSASTVVGSAAAVIILVPAVVLSRLSLHWGVKIPICLGLVFAVEWFGGKALERMGSRPHSRRQRFVETMLFWAPLFIGLRGAIDGMTPGVVIAGLGFGATMSVMLPESDDGYMAQWRRSRAAARGAGR